LEASVKKSRYAIVIEEGPTSFGATVPDLPGCFAVGRTRAEVERLIEEAITEHIALRESQGETVPDPKTQVASVTVG
jgi:predicted RNase H-like HicB family nuclease